MQHEHDVASGPFDAACDLRPPEEELGRRRVDGGVRFVIDSLPVVIAETGQLGCVRGVAVGIVAGVLNLAFPHIAVDIVAHGEGQHEDASCHCYENQRDHAFSRRGPTEPQHRHDRLGDHVDRQEWVASPADRAVTTDRPAGLFCGSLLLLLSAGVLSTIQGTLHAK